MMDDGDNLTSTFVFEFQASSDLGLYLGYLGILGLYFVSPRFSSLPGLSLRLSFWLEQNARDLMTEQFKMDEMHQLVANDMPLTLMMPGGTFHDFTSPLGGSQSLEYLGNGALISRSRGPHLRTNW